ncbi:MAG TPA: FAD-dependent oxidoreductase [Candidatus Krumholzibacteriaceae bacterium]|nr:FAD-dependent oxidoreductase [Candidatus Krumholzibacteriaceae bacterium]
MRVVIVGAGPAGLFAAHALSKQHRVTILERRDYVGGSGLHSDGKLNFHPKIGGDLTEFMSEGDAWALVQGIRDVFMGLGVEMAHSDEEGLRKLETRASQAGIKFIKIEQNHIGSDYLPDVIAKMQRRLEEQDVDIRLETAADEVVVEGGRAVAVSSDGESFEADAVLLAPGRIGSGWLIEQLSSLGVGMSYNPIDVGVRVEVPNEVMDQVINGYGCWDPKFHLYTPSYDDFVRTFCVCPAGYVVREPYGDGLFGANGHSMRDTKSGNTNFALLTRVSLTEPLENTTEYGRRIAQLANTLGGHKPIIQRLGDLRSHKRSTWDRLSRSHVEPTMEDVTPGDIAMAYPRRITMDFMESLEMLDRVMPGIAADSTLLYAPEIKFYAMRIQTDEGLRTSIPNLHVAGDGAGVSRGIVGAAATGLVAARGIMEQLG